MNEEYGVTGCVRRLEQRKTKNVGLEQLRNHDSFDVEFSPAGQVLRVTNYNMAGAVMGSEHFAYDDTGRVSRRVAFDNTHRQISRHDFVHNTEDSRVITTAESDGRFAGRTIEKYDGKLLLSSASYDSEDRLKKEKTFHYIHDKLQASAARHYRPDGTLVEQWLSNYDSQARIAETYGLKADGTPLGDGKYQFEYNSEGRRSRRWTFNEFVSDEAAKGVTACEYESDAAGNWVERREFHQWRGDSFWAKSVTVRKLTYYPRGEAGSD